MKVYSTTIAKFVTSRTINKQQLPRPWRETGNISVGGANHRHDEQGHNLTSQFQSWVHVTFFKGANV